MWRNIKQIDSIDRMFEEFQLLINLNKLAPSTKTKKLNQENVFFLLVIEKEHFVKLRNKRIFYIIKSNVVYLALLQIIVHDHRSVIDRQAD